MSRDGGEHRQNQTAKHQCEPAREQKKKRKALVTVSCPVWLHLSDCELKVSLFWCESTLTNPPNGLLNLSAFRRSLDWNQTHWSFSADLLINITFGWAPERQTQGTSLTNYHFQHHWSYTNDGCVLVLLCTSTDSLALCHSDWKIVTVQEHTVHAFSQCTMPYLSHFFCSHSV